MPMDPLLQLPEGSLPSLRVLKLEAELGSRNPDQEPPTLSMQHMAALAAAAPNLVGFGAVGVSVAEGVMEQLPSVMPQLRQVSVQTEEQARQLEQAQRQEGGEGEELQSQVINEQLDACTVS